MKYSEQIKSAKWQKRRLDILNRDEFTCQECGNKELTLHVHHKQYRKNASIWEYENWELTTLCEKCHSDTHEKLITKKEEYVKLIELLDKFSEEEKKGLLSLLDSICRYTRNGNFPNLIYYLYMTAISNEFINRIYNELEFLTKQREDYYSLLGELQKFQEIENNNIPNKPFLF
jgi:hypothetical protein